MNSATRRLLAEMQREADHWNRIATDPDDQSSFTRIRAEARRDAIDWAIAQVRRAAPDIEAEAVNEVERMDHLLEAV